MAQQRLIVEQSLEVRLVASKAIARLVTRDVPAATGEALINSVFEAIL